MKRLLGIVVVLAILGGAGALGWKVYQKATAPPQAARRGGRATVAVEVARVRRATIEDIERFSGTLRARSRFEVAPKIAGRLDKLLVDVADVVTRGQLVAALDAEEAAREVEQARAALEVAKANAEQIGFDASLEDEELVQKAAQAQAELGIAKASVEQCRSSLTVAEREYERAKALRDKTIFSQSEFDEAEARYLAEKAKQELALAQVAQKEAALRAAQVRLSETQKSARAAELKLALATVAQREAALKAAEVRLAYTQIKAEWDEGPDTRVIGERFVDAGAMLKANEPIVSVLDIQVLKAVIHVTERDYAKVRAGQTVAVTTDAVADRTFTGTIVRVAPLLREASRQAMVEVEVPNAEGLLKPGMFIRAAIHFGSYEDVTVVPRSAIVRRDGERGIFLADKEKLTAHFVAVTPGILDGDLRQVVDPPPSLDGGWVVTLGQHLLEDGGAITLPGEARPPAKAPGTATPPKGQAKP